MRRTASDDPMRRHDVGYPATPWLVPGFPELREQLEIMTLQSQGLELFSSLFGSI
jgi:hypothetical protein